MAQANQVTLADLWSWPRLRLQGALRWPDSLMARVESYRLSKGASPSLLVPDKALFPLDQDWPIAFDSLERPPLAVHWSGRKQCWPVLSAQKAVAVVGTRRPSDHGCRMAHALGQCLARAGWPVVSGLAEGIDAASHHGCLAADGLPVGVLGTPLDRVYPSSITSVLSLFFLFRFEFRFFTFLRGEQLEHGTGVHAFHARVVGVDHGVGDVEFEAL